MQRCLWLLFPFGCLHVFHTSFVISFVNRGLLRQEKLAIAFSFVNLDPLLWGRQLIAKTTRIL